MRYNPEIYRDNYQNFKRYNIPKAQLIISDVPYNLSNNAYASNPAWYKDGDNSNGESEIAGKNFFNTDDNFKSAEFMHFCSQMLRKEPKEKKLHLAWYYFALSTNKCISLNLRKDTD